MKKRCPDCNQEKEKNLFYKCLSRYDGVTVYCKDCTKKKQRANKDYFRNYQRKIRGITNPRGENRRWSKTNIKRDNLTSYNREYFRKRYSEDEEYRKKIVERNKEYRSKNKFKNNARHLLNMAINSGKIVRESCVVCKKKENIHGHHEDYNKPLEVIWLCPKCHANYHAGNISKEEIIK